MSNWLARIVQEIILQWLRDIQRISVTTSQSFFHKYTPRYTPLKFKKLSNVPNLTEASNYWEGPLNCGLCHALPAILCAIAMYFAFAMAPFWNASKKTVCLLKFIVSFIGFSCFVLVYFEIYGLFGIYHVWGPKSLFNILYASQTKVCEYIDAISGPFSERISTALARAGPALQIVSANVTGSKYKKALIAYTSHVTVLSQTSFAVSENIAKVVRIVKPICLPSVAKVTVMIGDRNLTNVTEAFQKKTVYESIGISVWTILLAVLVMRIILKKNTICLNIICGLGIFTVMLWWYAAGHLAPWLVGISDFNSLKADGMMPIIKELYPAMPKEIVEVFLQCSAKTQNNAKSKDFIKDLDKISEPIVKIHEASDLAMNKGFLHFSPQSQQWQYSGFLIELYNLTSEVYNGSKHISVLKDNNCTYFKKEFERLFSLLVREFYWAILVAYSCAVLIALLLTVAVVILLRIRCYFNYLCCYRVYEKELPTVCRPECLRRNAKPSLGEPGASAPLPPIRQRCLQTCVGVSEAYRKEVSKAKGAAAGRGDAIPSQNHTALQP
ncbi:hypothetical protein O0L34_g1893 [Tuta absoluta]|nr:hypothetical protein O0L34_g1893 [Tuta absoluta]